MSSQHKRPLLAFLVVTVACVVFMTYTVRAQALIGIIADGDGAVLAEASHRVLLGGVQATSGDDDRDRSARGHERETVEPDVARIPHRTALPRARTTPGAKVRHAWKKKAAPQPDRSEHARPRHHTDVEQPETKPTRRAGKDDSTDRPSPLRGPARFDDWVDDRWTANWDHWRKQWEKHVDRWVDLDGVGPHQESANDRGPDSTGPGESHAKSNGKSKGHGEGRHRGRGHR